ncbi:UNVERIFIED_CONTAM: putative inactive purple acid phosphatase 27 [Sesamum radiatum]|uniref:Inactive purple acid phosphatase 27 n=1 Tax=Sesamum radiatum TaxID=300843 RepID=A0AAW2UR45_SESRA
MPSAAFRVLRSFLLVFIIILNPANSLTLSSSSLPESLLRSTIHLRNHTAISEFRVVNRRHLINCPDHNPYLQLNISSDALSDDEYVTVNITGVLLPSSNDWVAMISPSHSNVKTCIENAIKYEQTGDFSSLPLLCHYPVKPGSISVTGAMADEVSSGSIDSIFHIGDISYATGFLVEWDFFLNLISPLASQVSYMTAIGNHERDYIDSGSVYITPDSGGECGVPYETYFPMPTAARDKPWYSIEQGSVHFTVISTEHNWSVNSEQFVNAESRNVDDSFRITR